MNDYEERKQARIDRYRERAEKARQRSGQLSHESISMLEHIPPGQPILVGHHSERGHRKLLERSDRKMEQSIAASEKADYYERKARAAENNTAISSDDPAALEKLRAKLAQLQEDQTFMKKVNAYYRKHQTCRGCEGVSPELAAKLDNSMENAYSWENAPYFKPSVQRHLSRWKEPDYKQALKQRQIWCEGTFAIQKRCHNLTRVLRRGLEAAEDHCLLSATALNLRRMIWAIT